MSRLYFEALPATAVLLAFSIGFARAEPGAEADRHFSLGRLDEAAAAYELAADSSPDAAAALRHRFLRGCILSELGSLEAAIKEFEAIRAAEPKARGATALAAFARRRLELPGEYIGDAIETVLIPSLRKSADPTAPWGDPVVSALLGEALLRSGPLYIDSDDLAPAVEANASDPEIILGAAQLLPPSRQAEVLEYARSQFPDHLPTQMACFFSLRFPDRPPSKESALRSLGAAAMRDTENALPRYLGIALGSFDTGPAPSVMTPLSRDAIDELERLNGLKSCDAYGAERRAALSRVLREMKHPFRVSLVQHTTSSVSLLNTMLRRFTVSIMAALAKDDLEEARRLRGIRNRMTERWLSEMPSSSMRNIAMTNELTLESAFGNWFAGKGDTAAATAAFEARKALSRELESVQGIDPWAILTMIPIPELSNYAVEQRLAGD